MAAQDDLLPPDEDELELELAIFGDTQLTQRFGHEDAEASGGTGFGIGDSASGEDDSDNEFEQKRVCPPPCAATPSESHPSSLPPRSSLPTLCHATAPRSCLPRLRPAVHISRSVCSHTSHPSTIY